MAGALGDDDPEAIAIAKSMEELRRCFSCGVKTQWLFQRIKGCPHFVCSRRGCLEELHCRWVDITKGLQAGDRLFADGQEPRRQSMGRANAVSLIQDADTGSHGSAHRPAQPAVDGPRRRKALKDIIWKGAWSTMKKKTSLKQKGPSRPQARQSKNATV